MKNSWIVADLSEDPNIYNYYCKCSLGFKVDAISKSESFEVSCPKCGNDYFIDALEWESGQGTRIWKGFLWEKEIVNSEDHWSVNLFFTIPRYREDNSKIIVEKQKLISASLSKKSASSVKYKHHYQVTIKYSLFLDDRTQKLKQLLTRDAEKYLLSNIMQNRTTTIKWIDESEIEELDLKTKLDCIRYFIKHPHLQEIDMFYWKMSILQNSTKKYTSQAKMLDYILKHKKEKSLKKSLFHTYKKALKLTGYYPYSDYIFARSIEDENFLSKLLSIYPAVKQHIFIDETFRQAIEFMAFLKCYYSEKQICKLFLSEMQNESGKISALTHWRDTLRLIQAADSFDYLNQYFSKVKLTTKNLHDEITRVSHLAAFDRGENSRLIYQKYQDEAQMSVNDLRFVLPTDTLELSQWAKKLHNCMFGYVNSIKNGISIIYGVFKNDEILYAVEIRSMQIVQALGKFNNKIGSEDMEIIKKWHNDSLSKLQ